MGKTVLKNISNILLQLFFSSLIQIAFPSFALSSMSFPFSEPQWNFVDSGISIRFVYTPFFVNNSTVTMYTGGPGQNPKNGFFRYEFDILNYSLSSQELALTQGPDPDHYNYFRAARVAKNESELWMLVEVSGCYTGCDSQAFPKSLAAYHSTDDGHTWSFIDFVKVDGKRYISQWFAHTGLVYNPEGSITLDLLHPENNRFITVGENRNILISADGVNFSSIAIELPFQKDRLVFAGLAKTPFGFHMTSCSNWSDEYFTTTVRHFFSKDLVHWIAIEPNSYLKNPLFYKGVHLSYDSKTNKLWAFSPCGSINKCNLMAWLEPRDFSLPKNQPSSSDPIPIGEYILISGQTAMITGVNNHFGKYTYKVFFSNGTTDSGYTKEMIQRPMLNYKKFGCADDGILHICIGDTVTSFGQYASVIGINDLNPSQKKYALRFNSGVIDAGYTSQHIQVAQ